MSLATSSSARRKVSVPTAASVLGLSIILMTSVGCAPQTSSPAAHSKPAPSAASSTKYPETSYSVESLRIPSTLSADDAVKLLFTDRLNAWDNAGKSDKFSSDFYAAMHQTKDGELAYAKDVAAKNAKVFSDALFVPNWESIPALANTSKDQEQTNYIALSLWGWTYHPDPADAVDYPDDKEPYQRSQTIENVETVSQTDDSGVYNVTVVLSDNRDKNSASRLTDQPDPNGFKLNAHVEIARSGHDWKVGKFLWSNK